MPVINPLDPFAPTEDGPCDWPLDTTCVEGWDALPSAVKSAATSWASYMLWALTGRQYGQCSVNYRPCGPKCEGYTGYLTWPVGAPGSTGGGLPWMTPWIDNGAWRNCGCAGGCTCRARCEVPFPGAVAGVNEVTIDGVVIPSTSYRMDVYRGTPVLVRTDGECWPECQDMDADPDEVGAFVITYQPGRAVPAAGRLAAGQLAGEFAKACQGGDCALPQQLASLSRNGVEVQVVDPTTLFENGLTGIANVDLWIRAVNPNGMAQRARVLSPDLRTRFTV